MSAMSPSAMSPAATIRPVHATFAAKEALEGAGVRLRRGFGYFEVPTFDPFLLFDDFSSKNPADYLAGFPWHPHRGIETVTYILDGDVRHRDSLGNEGVIGAGDLQWMTAGSGIIHEEMPEGTAGLSGFQLWVNLPKKDKMIRPRYQDLRRKLIPEVGLGAHARAKVIAGNAESVRGPVEDIMAEPLYLDVTLEGNGTLEFPVAEGHTAFAYVLEGAIGAGASDAVPYARGTIVLFTRSGGVLRFRAGVSGARFLIIAGRPIGEPVAWRGPIVMHTAEELREAFQELSDGTFIRPAEEIRV